jgi:cyclic 2,3-diphosphoglycerate synthetase
VLAGVRTVGCRRCGGGLAGAVGRSNVEEGAALAATLTPGLTIFEGSGAAAPPIACDRTLLISGVAAPREEVLGHLGPVRVLRADAIVLVGAEPGTEQAAAVLTEGLIELLGRDVPIVPAVLRPAPAVPVQGRRVVVFTTAPAGVHEVIGRHLAEEHGADVVAVVGGLADRPSLRAAFEDPAVTDAELWLTEIKAAAVDVVAEEADGRGIELGFFDNVPQAVDGSDRLDRVLLDLVDGARSTRR